jgi:hypothetical protein
VFESSGASRKPRTDYDIERSSDHGPCKCSDAGAVDGSGLIAFEDRGRSKPGTSYELSSRARAPGDRRDARRSLVEVPSLPCAVLEGVAQSDYRRRLRLELYVASDAEAALEVFATPQADVSARRIVVSRGAGSRYPRRDTWRPALRDPAPAGTARPGTRAVVMR